MIISAPAAGLNLAPAIGTLQRIHQILLSGKDFSGFAMLSLGECGSMKWEEALRAIAHKLQMGLSSRLGGGISNAGKHWTGYSDSVGISEVTRTLVAVLYTR